MTNNVNVMNEIEVLNAALQMGWVRFEYIKADGSHRTAIGTRNKALIESALGRELTAPKRARNYYTNCNGYFDLIRMDWRQFNTDRFVGMVFDHMSNEMAITQSILVGLNESLCESEIDAIESAASRLLTGNAGHRVVSDAKRSWCMRYNGGRGLNGVLLRAAGNGGSSCLGWVGNESGAANEIICATAHESHAEQPKRTQAELIAELAKLQARQNEILAELIG